MRVVPRNVGGTLGSHLQIYPQLFIIDRGHIVRVCATVAECR
jgi:hypothetical protein